MRGEGKARVTFENMDLELNVATKKGLLRYHFLFLHHQKEHKTIGLGFGSQVARLYGFMDDGRSLSQKRLSSRPPLT